MMNLDKHHPHAGSPIPGPGLSDQPQAEMPREIQVVPEEALPANQARATGSAWSHLGYGLAVAVTLVPFALPGLDMRKVFGIYLVAGHVIMVAFMVWGIVHSARDAWKKWVRRA